MISKVKSIFKKVIWKNVDIQKYTKKSKRVVFMIL